MVCQSYNLGSGIHRCEHFSAEVDSRSFLHRKAIMRMNKIAAYQLFWAPNTLQSAIWSVLGCRHWSVEARFFHVFMNALFFFVCLILLFIIFLQCILSFIFSKKKFERFLSVNLSWQMVRGVSLGSTFTSYDSPVYPANPYLTKFAKDILWMLRWMIFYFNIPYCKKKQGNLKLCLSLNWITNWLTFRISAQLEH